jgi:hypothetical protein
MMRTKTLQYLLFGVTLAFGLHAELLPNPSGESASGTSVGGNWFGLSVQDSGFLLTNASAQSASDHAADQEGFAAYFTGTPRSESNSQLSSSGSFSPATGVPGAVSAIATLTAIASSTDIITETYSSTGFNARPAAMSSSASPAQMSSYSNSYANAWQLSSQSSYNQQPTAQSVSDAEYAARLVYGGSYAPQNSNSQGYNPATGYSYLSPYNNAYSWNAPVNNPAPQSNAVDDSMFFALMNAGMSIWAPSYYVPATVNFSGQQLVSAPIPPPQFVSNVTGVPEPSTWAMILSAAAAIAARRRFTRS